MILFIFHNFYLDMIFKCTLVNIALDTYLHIYLHVLMYLKILDYFYAFLKFTTLKNPENNIKKNTIGEGPVSKSKHNCVKYIILKTSQLPLEAQPLTFDPFYIEKFYINSFVKYMC